MNGEEENNAWHLHQHDEVHIKAGLEFGVSYGWWGEYISRLQFVTREAPHRQDYNTKFIHSLKTIYTSLSTTASKHLQHPNIDLLLNNSVNIYSGC